MDQMTVYNVKVAAHSSEPTKSSSASFIKHCFEKNNLSLWFITGCNVEVIIAIPCWVIS